MPQSIDFLKVLPKPVNRVPTWLMALLIIVPVLFLVFVSIISYISYSKAKENLDKQEESLAIAQTDYNKLIKKYPLLADNTPLLNHVSKIEQEYAAKLEKFESLKHLLVRPGFSKYLLNLAEVTPSSIWLNRIQIDHSLSQVTVNGFVINPDSVSTFMSNLSTTKAFSDVIFNSFFVKAVKSHSYAKFAISTSDISPEEEDADELSGPAATKVKE